MQKKKDNTPVNEKNTRMHTTQTHTQDEKHNQQVDEQQQHMQMKNIYITFRRKHHHTQTNKNIHANEQKRKKKAYKRQQTSIQKKNCRRKINAYAYEKNTHPCIRHTKKRLQTKKKNGQTKYTTRMQQKKKEH